MSVYTTGALVALILFGMGFAAAFLGGMNMMDSNKSKAGIQMFLICFCVFIWDIGYAWMSLCYNDDFAYVPRAMALLSVTFYMLFSLRYVATITEYPKKILNTFLVFFVIISLIAWVQIIQKSAVDFTITPWGYWYHSKVSPARYIQFLGILMGLVMYYVILHYGIKRASLEREKYTLKQFIWFGPIFFIGCIFDTLAPIIFKTAAIPGSGVSAFFSAMILFRVSQVNKVFGLSKANVSEYVFEDVHIPVIIADNSGKILLFNEATPIYFGCDPKALKGERLASFIESDMGDTVKVVSTDLECKVDKTDVRDQFDTLLYSIYFLRDVTKERQAFRMLEESRAVAEEANRAKSNFLANMSHEIRTPMNAIIGMSEIILQEGAIPEKAIAQVKDIQNAGQNLLGIVNDILDISKVEAGKYELVVDEYDVPSLIHDVSNIIGVRLQESNTAFVIEADPTLPARLLGDVNRVRQILLNILGNAVKFTRKGSISLNISWNHDRQSPNLLIDVKDTGIGIKPEDIDRIFGEFNQVDTRRNRNIQGTGLGLAISKHLAELMGGDITVESVYTEGSTFHICLCQGINEYVEIGENLAKALKEKRYKAEIMEQKSDIVPRPNARVLIVDDTRINLTIAKGLMAKYEMQIDLAISGKQAIEMVKRKDYDIIFMDHMMPEMDGVEATKEIRKLGEKYENIPIIALTANAINDAKEMFSSEGLQDFVAKPIDVKVLDEIIERWIPV